MNDTYLTIEATAEGIYTEKRSKFLAFAIPIKNADEVKKLVEEYQKRYYDARHWCYAYMLGADRKEFRVNDNGEPSGTAGKPILGQINSNELTNILIVVIRYFGGIKLGTGGLVVAYKTAAAEAIAAATIVEKMVEEGIICYFEYPFMNSVMRIVKEESATIVAQGYESNCSMTLRTRKSLIERLTERLSKIDTLYFGE